jgi:hypothetical protein
MRAIGRRAILLAGAVVAVLGLGGTAPAATGTAHFVVGGGCQEHQAFVEGDEAAVAARLPKRYTALRDPGTGKPLVFARAMHCEKLTLAGRTAPVTVASFGVVIESPDGRGCGSGAPTGSVKGDNPPLCNWYVLFWVANDRRVVDFLRHGTPGYPAVYVPNLVFESGDFDPARGGAPLHFEAPAPTPSPFTMDDVARERPGELAIRVGYWTDTPQGTVKLAGSSEDLTAGDATGVVHARPGSEMAKVFGADERPYLPGYSAFAAVRIGHGSYRKQILGPAPRTDSFAGECSSEGQVKFNPPATNTVTPLTATYDANGKCTGKLNGRQITDAPVKFHNSAQADGSCPSARTTSPGQGTLTFADGTRIGVTVDFSFTATEGSVELYGDRSGFAGGHGTFVTQRTPPDLTAQCSGEGVKEAPLDVTFTTDSPLVSQRPAARQPLPGPRKRPRLRLAVSPRRVETGHRTAFRFRVTSKGRAVAGAVVRFAGRRAVTGRKGRARIVATLRHSGRRKARALKAGFVLAHATVRVRRG